MRVTVVWLMAMVLLAALPGCQTQRKPQPREIGITSPYPQVWTYGVAPGVNLSGSSSVDGLRVADTLFAELQQVQGLEVLPVNKTLAAMEKLGIRSIDSVATAQKIAAALGVDALVVPAVTAYDPYRPPTIGMVLQLYTPPLSVATSEPTARQITGEPLDTSPPRQAPQPVSDVAAVFNASNQSVLQELREFSMGRTNEDSALGAERYLADQDAYLRFVTHEMVARLMEVERARLADR